MPVQKNSHRLQAASSLLMLSYRRLNAAASSGNVAAAAAVTAVAAAATADDDDGICYSYGKIANCLALRSRVTLGADVGRCVETVLASGGMVVAATWGGDLVDGSSGRLLAGAAHGGQRVTKLATGGEG
jgi:hypothetical protein